MSRLRAAVLRLERTARQRGDSDRSEDWPLMHMLSVCLLSHTPQWEGLTAADCDADTWREIEETRAWAEHRYEHAMELARARIDPPDWAKLSAEQMIDDGLRGGRSL